MLDPSEPSTVAALLLEAAVREDSIAAVTGHGESAWTIEFDAGTRFIAEFAMAPARLVLTGSIGASTDELQSAALAFNFLWEETGGCRIAQGDENEVVLIQELYPETLGASDIGALLLWFEAMRALWELLLRSGKPAPAPAALRDLVQGLRV